MKWYEGSIPAAIQAAKAKSAVFIVYISGDDDMSRQMEEVWNDSAVCDLCEKERCVGLSLTSTSPECKQFGEIYPVVCVPCTFFISNSGVPLEVIGGHLETRDFYRKIQDAIQMHKGLLGSETPAVGASEVPAAPVVSPPATVSVTTPTGAQPTPAIPEPEVTPSEPPPTEPVTTMSNPAEPAQPVQPAQPAEPAQPAQATSSQPNQSTVEDRVQKAREVIEEKRRLKAQKEKEEEKEKEKQRRELGANLQQFQKMKADAEADELKKLRLKEKREEKEARERVRKQIAADKADRIARNQKEKEERQNIAAQPSTSSASPAPAVDKARMENARLQFRLPDGRAFTNQFQSSEPLSVAKEYVASMASSLGPFRLSTTYPKRIFTSEDMSQSLLDLNLAPSAVIVVLPGGSGTTHIANTESVFSFKFLTMVLSYPFITLWSFITSFFTPPPLHTHRRPTPQAAPTAAARPSSSKPSAPDSQASSSSRNRPKSSYGVRRRQEGNIHRLSADDSDDEQNTWNGNSTQQM